MRNILHNGIETLSIGGKNYEIPTNLGYKVVGEVTEISTFILFKSVWDFSVEPREFGAILLTNSISMPNTVEIEVGSHAVFYHLQDELFVCYGSVHMDKEGVSCLFYLEDEEDLQTTLLTSGDELLTIKSLTSPAVSNIKIVLDYEILGPSSFVHIISTDTKKVIIDTSSFGDGGIISEREDCAGTLTGGGWMNLSCVGGKLNLSGESVEDVYVITGIGDLTFSTICCDGNFEGPFDYPNLASAQIRFYDEEGELSATSNVTTINPPNERLSTFAYAGAPTKSIIRPRDSVTGEKTGPLKIVDPDFDYIKIGNQNNPLGEYTTGGDPSISKVEVVLI